MLNMLKPFGGDEEKDFLQDIVNYMTLTEADEASRERELNEKLKICDILQADVDINVNEELLDKAPNLKYVLCTSVGTDYVDLEAASKRGIIVANNPDFCNVAVGEFTMALMYAVMRRIPCGIKAAAGGNWDSRDYLEQTELFGKTLGIVGFGKIGRDVARQAIGIGMKVQVRKSERNLEAIKNAGAIPVTFEELLKTSDIITLHVPMADNTKDLIGEKEFEIMKAKSYLINVARGGVVDESALLKNLNNGKLSGAALDVLVDEPPQPDNPLLNYEGDNLIITPHIAWFTKEADEKCGNYLREQVKAIIDNDVLQGIVNK